MAPVTKSIQHFTHPGHPLREVYEAQEYLCDGCKTLGFGVRYRCNTCDFDLHEHCTTCTPTLSSYMHPQHQLTLVVRKQQGMRQNERVCDVCRERVEGLFYRCKLCEFDVHPLCTQLPQTVRHAVHPQHFLTLQLSSPCSCTICRGLCSSWRYKCGPCSVDLHIECVLAPSQAPRVPSSPQPSPQPPPPTPSPHGAYACEIPTATYPYGHHNHGQRVGETNGGRMPKMYAVVGKLAFGVLSNGLFGTPDFSSFL